MEYITRNLESDPGMTQKEALLSLQKDPTFKPGSIVASIRLRKNAWVAEVLEPKTAEFPPPSKDEEPSEEETPEPQKSEAPSSDSDSDGGGDSDASPSEDLGGGPDDKPKDKPAGGKADTETAILHTLQQILHALQGGGAPEGMGGLDALGPGPGGDGPPPPKGGGPAGPPAPGGPPKGKGGLFGGPKPMKPGDTPPGGTPIGAPAFSNTKQANPSLPGVAPSQGTPVPSGQTGPVGAQAGGVCPACGGPEPCPMHGGLNQSVAAYSGKAATITLTTEGKSIKQAVTEARPVVENYGYEVKQAKSENGRIHILASRR